MLTAIVSPVPIGNRSIEGLLLQDGTYAIAVPQICSIFQFPIKHASRDLKDILGTGFQFPKARTTLHPKAVNCVTLKDFEILTFELVLRGNSSAIAKRCCKQIRLSGSASLSQCYRFVVYSRSPKNTHQETSKLY